MALTLFARRAAVAGRSLAPFASPCGSIRTLSTPVNDAFNPIAPTSQPPPPGSTDALRNAVHAQAPRYDWTKDEIRQIYNTPLMELAFQAVGIRTIVGVEQSKNGVLNLLTFDPGR